MHPFRVSLRNAMIHVAVIGVLFGIVAGLRARSRHFETISKAQERLGYEWMRRGGGFLMFCGESLRGLSDKQRAELFDKKYRGRGPIRYRAVQIAQHHFRLSFKYERAALCPWIPLSADPPEPG